MEGNCDGLPVTPGFNRLVGFPLEDWLDTGGWEGKEVGDCVGVLGLGDGARSGDKS